MSISTLASPVLAQKVTVLVDSHCHLDRLKLEKIESGSLDQVIEEAAIRGVTKMLCVGIDMNNAAAVKAVIAAVEEQEVGFKSLHSTPLHNLKY